MQRLFTVCFPEISAESAAFINSFRRSHDARHRDVVEAHFTMVFGSVAVARTEYTDHIAAVAAGSKPIAFVCKYAMLGADDEDETAYVFLVPDQGFAELSLLHDCLYTGCVQDCLRLDLPYIPHITIGTLSDRAEAKAICDELNSRGLCIEGCVKALTIGTIEGGKFSNLSQHVLGEASEETSARAK